MLKDRGHCWWRPLRSVILQTPQSSDHSSNPARSAASFSFSTCNSSTAARREGFSLWRWPVLRVQHGEKTLFNCSAGNSLRWGRFGRSTCAEGKRDRPVLLNHHPDLCPRCGHSGWCYCTWTNTWPHTWPHTWTNTGRHTYNISLTSLR